MDKPTPDDVDDIAELTGRRHAHTISLALQGGGAHGAFTWGVLDRLLEDERIAVDGVSATSAGAMKGAVLVYGMIKGGRAGARVMLRQFWEAIAETGRNSILQPSMFDKWMGNHSLDNSPMYQFLDVMTRVFSPYQLNPAGVNPLRKVLEDVIDFERLQHSQSNLKLFVNATNVRTGKIRVFKQKEVTVDALLASACLPHVFQAVEIDGEHYWDGGFMGNPAMFPLIYNCKANDIVLIEINPIVVKDVPDTARAIIDRVNTISFNATMMREMRAIALVTRLLAQHRLAGRTNMRQIHFHMIQAEAEMAKFGASSKMNTDIDFLETLFRLGRATGEQWLADHYGRLGVESSIDLQKLFF